MTESFTMPIIGTKERFTWEPTAAHHDQAERNHSQSLKRLRERGGLSWSELYCVVFGRKLFSILHNDENQLRCKHHLLATQTDAAPGAREHNNG